MIAALHNHPTRGPSTASERVNTQTPKPEAFFRSLADTIPLHGRHPPDLLCAIYATSDPSASSTSLASTRTGAIQHIDLPPEQQTGPETEANAASGVAAAHRFDAAATKCCRCLWRSTPARSASHRNSAPIPVPGFISRTAMCRRLHALPTGDSWQRAAGFRRLSDVSFLFLALPRSVESPQRFWNELNLKG